MKKFKIIKILFICIVIAVILAAAGGLTYLSLHEYSPGNEEELTVQGPKTKPIYAGDTITAVTYSIGYGIHDNTFDCKLEGGTMSKAADDTAIQRNMEPILFNITSLDPDIVLLQEVDRNSARSYYYDETEMIKSGMEDYNSVFANNFLCDYVPIDLLGRTDSGLQTLTRLYALESAQRVSLPEDEKWPLSTAAVKECMLVERVELRESPKQLVIINVHLTNSDTNIDQYKEIAKFMQLEFAKGNYVIAGGNFNAMLPSVNAKNFPAIDEEGFYPEQLPMSVLTGGWKYCTDDRLPSARRCDKKYEEGKPDIVQTYVTDGFICSPNTIVEETKTSDTEFIRAAHNPVSVKVTLVK